MTIKKPGTGGGGLSPGVHPVVVGSLLGFLASAAADIGHDERDEVLMPVRVWLLRDVLGCLIRLDGLVAGPSSLPGGSVLVELRAGEGDPLPEALPRHTEVEVPGGGRTSGGLGIVSAPPTGVDRAELPDELGMPVPVRRDDRGGETVLEADPVDPGVELEPLRLRVGGGERAPVDGVRDFSEQLADGVLSTSS